MRAHVWGCRGSLATPGADTVRYGGNTSCVEVRLDDGTLLVLDAGTGVMPLGLSLAERGDRLIHLLLTHLHLDHVEGFGFFEPIWDAGTELHVWGPPSSRRALAERLARYLSPPLFPMELSDIPARLTFHDVPDEPWRVGGALVVAEHVVHPGPTVGYRIEGDGRALAYLPDHEPGLGGSFRRVTTDWVSGYGVATGADVLLHDSQYTDDEYAERVGWGHSSIVDTVAYAELAGVERLVLFHHDPRRPDAALDEHLEHGRSLARDTRVELAREGAAIEV